MERLAVRADWMRQLKCDAKNPPHSAPVNPLLIYADADSPLLPLHQSLRGLQDRSVNVYLLNRPPSIPPLHTGSEVKAVGGRSERST